MTSSKQIGITDRPVGTVRVLASTDAVHVTLAGEIDVDPAGELDEAARTVCEHTLPVLVDATDVTFMDSTGVRFLARCYGHGPLTVTASPAVRFLLGVLAMDDVLRRPDDM
jgi:anti-anti-sigma factor